MNQRLAITGLAWGLAFIAAGCSNMPGMGGSSESRPAAAPATAPATTKAAAPAPASPAPAASKIGPGMNDRGDVVDPKKVESGFGQKVKGLEDWDGEITGRPAPGSKFTQLRIGMPMKQVTDIVGPPSDQGVYMTGKAWIPFYFGSDKHRHELVYKGQGRLIFAGPAGFQYGSGNLVWIIHSSAELGYR